ADMLCIDSNMRTLSIASADAKSAENEAPVYMYFLTWTSENDRRGQGCYHGLDISLSFNNPDDEHQVIKPGDPKAAALADKMSDLWVNFAKSGVPSAAGVPEWPAYNADNGATMILDNECVIKNNFDREVQGILYDFLK
ncbi:MAG: carboxylesterase family protein, partial [Bacteroidia bacterium]|nr:carboxylesterase family protein [Bacteroidia bacterium]